jgi:hypothetical protein
MVPATSIDVPVRGNGSRDFVASGQLTVPAAPVLNA